MWRKEVIRPVMAGALEHLGTITQLWEIVYPTNYLLSATLGLLTSAQHNGRADAITLKWWTRRRSEQAPGDLDIFLNVVGKWPILFSSISNIYNNPAVRKI